MGMGLGLGLALGPGLGLGSGLGSWLGLSLHVDRIDRKPAGVIIGLVWGAISSAPRS